MCLVIPRNLYLSSVMEIPSEIESSYHLCNRSNIDQSNWTNHNISQSIIAAPGNTFFKVCFYVFLRCLNNNIYFSLFKLQRNTHKSEIQLKTVKA